MEGGEALGPNTTQVPGTPLFVMTAPPRKGEDFAISGMAFLHAARLLMYSYTLVSCQDESGSEWMTFDVALGYISLIEKYVRMDSKGNHTFRARILDTEMDMRREWFRANQENLDLSLGEVITAVTDKFANQWPMQNEYLTAAAAAKFAVTNTKSPHYGSGPKGSHKGKGDRDPRAALNEIERRRQDMNTRDNRRSGQFKAPAMCHRHLRGRCSLGDACKYAHTQNELTAEGWHAAQGRDMTPTMIAQWNAASASSGPQGYPAKGKGDSNKGDHPK